MTMSYAFNPLKEAFMYETIPKRLKYFAEETPNKTAFVFYSSSLERLTLTCAELYEQSLCFARGLKELGIGRGDVVALGVSNIPEWLICHFGIIIAGGIVLRLKFASEEEVKHVIKKAGTCAMIIFDSGKGGNNDEIVKTFAAQTSITGEIYNPRITGLRYAIHCGKDSHVDYLCTYETIMQMGSSSKVELCELDPDQICVMQLTSGTTGLPKLIPWSHYFILAISYSFKEAYKIEPDDVYFNAQPFSGGAGYIFNYIYTGCTRVTADDLFSRGSHEAVAQIIADIISKEKCTVALVFGRYCYDLMEDSIKLGSQFPLKCMLMSGYPLRQSISRIIGKVTRRFLNIYTCTDIGSISMKEIVPGSKFSDYNCGAPAYGVEVKVVDENGALCPRNKLGVIQVRSRVHFPGYVNDPEKTANAKRQGGWFHTDDSGYMTNDGEIFVLGRQTDLIYISNARVAPCVVESMIEKHPKVQAVAVVPVPDEITFQQLCACVVPKPEEKLCWEDMKEFLHNEIIQQHRNNQLTDLMPKYHVFLDSIPVTVNGKLEKKKLIEHVLQHLNLSP